MNGASRALTRLIEAAEQARDEIDRGLVPGRTRDALISASGVAIFEIGKLDEQAAELLRRERYANDREDRGGARRR